MYSTVADYPDTHKLTETNNKYLNKYTFVIQQLASPVS